MSERSEIYPTPERGNHDPVERGQHTIEDSTGGIGDPFRVVSSLERLERRGAITPAMRYAGDEFAAMFYLAHLEPLKAANMGKPHAVSGRAAGVQMGPEIARRYIRARLRLLGVLSKHASIAWHCLGEKRAIRSWCIMQSQNNRPISVYKAAQILIETLTQLAEQKPLDKV